MRMKEGEALKFIDGFPSFSIDIKVEKYIPSFNIKERDT